jgi:hypothetical protein
MLPPFLPRQLPIRDLDDLAGIVRLLFRRRGGAVRRFRRLLAATFDSHAEADNE